MKNWKKWFGRGMLAALTLVILAAIYLAVSFLVETAIWSEAKMDITKLFAGSECVAEFEGEKVLLCRRANNSMFKFLQTGEIIDRKTPKEGRQMLLTLEQGSILVTEDESWGVYLRIDLDGKQKQYHVRLDFSFEDMVELFNGSAGENKPL